MLEWPYLEDLIENIKAVDGNRLSETAIQRTGASPFLDPCWVPGHFAASFAAADRL